MSGILMGVVASLAGGPFVFADTINSTIGSYNVDDEAVSAGWNGTDIVQATITINSSGDIISTVTLGFDTGALVADSTVALIVQSSGFARGRGGTGGNGGVNSNNGTAGFVGNPAVNFQVDGTILVDSGGVIAGGGGGGGGGAGAPGFLVGGGGGGGYPNGVGGTGNIAGSVGTTSGGGAGGAGEFGVPSASDGGNGGNAATGGTAGNPIGKAGGGAGSAIEKNGNTVGVTNNGTITGAINA